MGLESVLLILIGLFSFVGGLFDWDWFMNNRRAVRTARLVGGRQKARWFYMFLGVLVAGFGLYLGVIK